MLPKDAPQQETVRLGSGARRWRPRLRIHWRALSPQLGSGGSAAHGGERDLVDRQGGDSRRRGQVRSHAARPESKPGSKIGPAPRRTSREPRRFSHYHHNWGLEDQRRMVVNAILWTAKVEIPAGGAKCDLTPQDLKANLDPK